ncbi:MAG: toll/interleukin-1 receptor domain-containing protein [Acidobacteria bacterium]|nr:toll/interleukin-1 receptor domain-containing protein [Acidobacteriota bacterium]
MKTVTSRRSRHFDAFISHASKDSQFAAQLVEAIELDGLKAWIDQSDVRFGALLRKTLQAAIRNCRVLVLFWSKAASNSRWVMAEIFTALHSGRFIIPCVLDRTPLPQFLQNTAYLDRRRDKADLGRNLCRAIRDAPKRGNEVAPFIAGARAEVEGAVSSVAKDQAAELDAQPCDLAKATEIHGLVDAKLKVLEKEFLFEPMILSAAGYHRKNAYLNKHWDAIQAGQAPKDPLLDEAESFFFKVLCFKPLDPSSLNGLCSVLILERELDATEFFVRRAIELAGGPGRYPDADHDLRLILHFRSQQSLKR